MAIPVLVNPTSWGSTTIATAHDADYPAHSTGDLIIQWACVDTITSIRRTGSAPNSETITDLFDQFGEYSPNQNAGPRVTAWYWIATDNTAAGSVAVTSGNTKMTSGQTVVVESGNFDAADPIPDVSALNYDDSGGGGEVTMPSFTATDAGGLVVMFGGADSDAMVSPTFSPAGWTDVSTFDAGNVSSCVATRDAATTASETIAAADFAVDSGDTTAAFGLVIKAAAASGITGSGAPTLARVAAASAGSTQLATTGSGSPSLQRVTGSGSGTPTMNGSGAPTRIARTASGVGSTLAPAINGSGAPALAGLSPSGSGLTYSNFVGSGAATFDAVYAEGEGLCSISGSGSATLTRLSAFGVSEELEAGTSSQYWPRRIWRRKG